MISKIERPEAIENLEEIIEESYAVMVARGDMGVELGAPEAVPSLQKRIIKKLSLAASRHSGHHGDADARIHDPRNSVSYPRGSIGRRQRHLRRLVLR